MTTQEIHTVLESHNSSIGFTQLWSNGIIYIKLDDNIEVTHEDVQRLFEYLKLKYDQVNKQLVLVEVGRYTSISNEAREFATKPESNAYTKATAVIVKSLSHRIIINFIINFTRQQTMKMRMFDNKQKATDWLLSFKNKV